MAIDVYLQIDGIKGESCDSEHQGWIECENVSWSLTWMYTQQKITGGSGGRTVGGWHAASNRIAI